MTIDEAQQLARLATGFGLGALAGIAVAFVFMRFFVPAYLSEKGKNLATREDIAAITREVERIRAEYSALTEELRARHQLRLAAVDRRLQSHQAAFTHWWELMGAIHTPAVHAAVVKCQTWWAENCVYLEPVVREAFVDAFRAASIHSSMNQPGTNAEELKANWGRIEKFGTLLLQTVQLPGLSELEMKAIAEVSGGAA